MPYKYLSKAAKGLGLEVHHLIEKRFASKLGLKADEILSIAIDKDTHRQITKLMREKIGYALDLKNPFRTTNVDAQKVWDATRDVYKQLEMTKYLDALKEQLINAGKRLNWGEW